MRFFRTLQGRLTVGYAVALLIGLCVFAVASGIVLAKLSEAVLDARLRTSALAVAAIVGDSGNGLQFDKSDIDQFDRLITPRLDGAIIRNDGSIAVNTGKSIAPDVFQLAAHQSITELTLRTVQWRDGDLRVAVIPLKQGIDTLGTAAVWASTEPLEDFRRLLVLVFGLTIPLIVIVAAGAGRFVTRRGLAPLRDIANLATHIEAHDLSQRLHPRSEEDELGALSATFDRMLDRLQAAFRRQRQFTADASHELRAPLSVIRAEADLALSRNRDPDEYRLALESIASEADRLEALISDLLALARAEGVPTGLSDSVDLAPIVTEVAERLRPVAQRKGVKLEPIPASPAIVNADPAALSRVALALVHNAVKYAAAGGHVRIEVTKDAGEEIRLSVSDDGGGFSEEGLRRATERFWRDDQVRRRDGSGLGLAIVRATVERFGGSVELRNAPGAGAEVIVRFPAAG